MTTEIKTEALIRDILFKNRIVLLKVITVLCQGAFNMKGQEFEQILGYIIQSSIKNDTVSIPQKKSGPDLEFEYQGIKREIDLKFYGTGHRTQLSTLNSILQPIRNKFQHIKRDRSLSLNEKKWLIDKINSINKQYTLSIFARYTKKEKSVAITIFDFTSLDLSLFLNLPFQLKRVAPEQRIEIHIPIIPESILEISAGANPFNRGMWISKISKQQSFDLINETGFINIISQETSKLSSFNKQDYIFAKAKGIIEFTERLSYEK